MGDDPMNLYGDPEDAIKPTFYDEASGSDDPSQGNTGSLDDTDPKAVKKTVAPMAERGRPACGKTKM